jgi:SAM-dependent methyltransferase
MYAFLRLNKKIIARLVAFVKAPFIIRHYILFKNLDTKKRFKIPFLQVSPCLFDNVPFTRFDAHYIYHTAWAARKVKEIDANKHVDISSSLYFSSIVSAFKPVLFYDYRPANLNLTGLSSSANDLNNLTFPDNSVESLSCMHTVEHVGLGRYGDTIDPEGDVKAARELSRVVAKGGNLLFVVPVGKPRIEFNAHRIYSYKMVVDLFPGLTLKEFTLIPDNAIDVGMQENASPENVDSQSYACGCFWFVKA